MAFDTVAALNADMPSWSEAQLAQFQCPHLPLDAQKVLRVEGFRNEIRPEVVLVRA